MKKIIIGNLKMNILSQIEREKYFKAFKTEQSKIKLKDVDIILCPSIIHLEAFKKWDNKKISLGAQNISTETSGSYTGEISPVMAKNIGAEFSIIGHSERRKYFNESNEEINFKVIAALKNGLKPIICVGETQDQKDNQETLQIITSQVEKALFKVSRARAEKIIIAYEPIWAIGTGVVPDANEVMEAKVLIRRILVETFGKKYAEKVPILYGGSVNVKNTKEVCLESEMDGALIGGASLNPHEFLKIAEIIDNN